LWGLGFKIASWEEKVIRTALVGLRTSGGTLNGWSLGTLSEMSALGHLGEVFKEAQLFEDLFESQGLSIGRIGSPMDCK
jgi:hypothetical protein